MPGAQVERRPVPPLPVPARRVPESLPARMAFGAWRSPHLSVPLSVPPGLWLGAEIAHAIGPYACGSAATVAVLGSAAMWLEAPRRWPDPDDGARWWKSRAWWARASCLGGCGWTALASWLGPAGADAPALGVLLLAGGAAWGGRYWWRKRPGRGRERGRKARAAARELAGWDAWWQLHDGAWGAPGSRVVNVTHDGVTTVLRVQLVPGRQVMRALKANEHLIESGFDGQVAAGMVRVAAVDGNPALADVHIKRSDPLAGDVKWDEGLAPRSVHDPWPQGMSEAGKWRMAPQRVSSFIVGASRTGKSNQQLVRVACLSRCEDARTVLVELKGRAARYVLRAAAAEYVITTVAEARDYLLMLVTEIGMRAIHAGVDGGEQLEATAAEWPAIMTLIDEVNDLASLTAGDPACTLLLAKVAAKGMGVEVYTDVAAQLGTLEESVGTDQTRSNLPLRVSFRTTEARHGQYAIGEKTALDTTTLGPAGAFLVKHGADAPQEKMRAVAMSPGLFAEVAESRLEDPPLALWCGSGPCPVPGYRTWQEWWARRWERLPEWYRGDSPQYQAHMPSLPEQEPQAAPAPVAATQGSGNEPPPAAPAPPPPGAPEHVRRAAFAAAAEASAGQVTTPAALVAASGMGRTWVQQRLRYLVTAGVAAQVATGEYVITPGAGITAALAAEKAGDDAALAALLDGGDAPRPRLHAV